MYDELVEQLRAEGNWLGFTERLRDLFIQSADAIPHWIPVTDHTPKYSGYYLVCDNDNDVYTAYFGNTTKNWWTEKIVTHWMPRPKPPKEKT